MVSGRGSASASARLEGCAGGVKGCKHNGEHVEWRGVRSAEGACHGPLARILGACTCRPARARASFYTFFYVFFLLRFCFLPLFEIRIKASFSTSGELMRPDLRYHDCTIMLRYSFMTLVRFFFIIMVRIGKIMITLHNFINFIIRIV